MSETGSRGGGIDSRSGKGAHVWERWAPLWHAAFYVALAITTAVVLSRARVSGPGKGAILALVVGLAGWYG
ncbi:MAG: hypothetical protein ACRDHO_04210, partial [Actinomycetota bacterium]